MYGWRARIGHVAPSRGDTLVYEFYKMFPEGFMMLNTTGTVRPLVDNDFAKQLQRIEEAVQDLVDNNCDSIIFSGSPLFTRLPFGTDREMGQKLTEKFGVPVAAGLTAEVEALKARKIKKLVVGTPYEEEINQRLKRHLEASGFEVLQIAGYGVRKNAQLTDLPVHASYKIAKRLYAKGRDADDIFIPCRALADHRGRGTAGRGDRQTSDHQQPGVHLARHEVDRHQGKCERLRTVDGKFRSLRSA